MTRTMMRRAIAPGLLALFALASPAHAAEYSLSVEQVMIETGQGQRLGVGYNGASPGPLLSFEEGEEAVIHVTNNLPVDTSVHWHGLILPFTMDGVPGVSFDGIKPGETFTYRFPIKQSGTYWYHSHSGMQEGDGAYGPIVIKPKGREPYRYDRDYVVQFTDAHPHSGHRIARKHLGWYIDAAGGRAEARRALQQMDDPAQVLRLLPEALTPERRAA